MALNRILDNSAREEYKDDIAQIAAFCPDMYARKIPAANVQQGFVFHTVKELVPDKNADILCAGSWEDTASCALRRDGYNNIVDLDPMINYTLHEYVLSLPKEEDTELFDAVFSTSVVEHVHDDEEYFDDVIRLVKSGGYFIVTFDYKPDWEPGQRVPVTSLRFYTPDSVKKIVKQFRDGGFSVFGGADYDGDIDFNWEGIPYTFGTAVFKKK